MSLVLEGDDAAAAELLRQVTELVPGWAAAWVALGEAAEHLGDEARALDAYRRAAACSGGEALGAGTRRARLEGDPDAATLPSTYVAALFDAYAPRFEAHLLGALRYRGPALLMDALAEVGAAPRFGRVLDLGCGTGLMGRATRARAEWLAGVDLSSAMVEAARRTGIYDALSVGPLDTALAQTPGGSLDLVLAADVFAYCGDLRPVLAAVARALAGGGLAAFTVQHSDAAPVQLGADLRVAHSVEHVRGALEAAGLTVRHLVPHSARREGGADVPGLVVVAGKP